MYLFILFSLFLFLLFIYFCLTGFPFCLCFLCFQSSLLISCSGLFSILVFKPLFLLISSVCSLCPMMIVSVHSKPVAYRSTKFQTVCFLKILKIIHGFFPIIHLIFVFCFHLYLVEKLKLCFVFLLRACKNKTINNVSS